MDVEPGKRTGHGGLGHGVAYLKVNQEIWLEKGCSGQSLSLVSSEIRSGAAEPINAEMPG